MESVHVGALPLVDLGEGDHLAVKRSTELCSGRRERGEGVEQAGAQSDAPHKEPGLGSPATQWLEPRPAPSRLGGLARVDLDHAKECNFS